MLSPLLVLMYFKMCFLPFHFPSLLSYLIKASSSPVIPDVPSSMYSWVDLQIYISQQNRVFVLFRPSLLPGLVAFTTDFSENDPIDFNGFDSDAFFCQPSLELVVVKSSGMKTYLINPKLMSSFSFTSGFLICPFMISFTKIATQIYPKGKDDSLGNFFWMSSWLAVVFTSWVNSLGSLSLCTDFFPCFKGNSFLFCGLAFPSLQVSHFF